MDAERTALHRRIAALIDQLADGSRDDGARDALLVDLASYQARHIPAYQNLVRARMGATAQPAPALPTDVFRFARVASHPPARDVRVFESSGTTANERSHHAFSDLSLYDRAAHAAARHALFPDRERMPLVCLAPGEDERPHSSLSYMLARFDAWFGQGPSCMAWRDDTLLLPPLVERLREAERTGTPVALLGTSFAFVHALDGLGETRFQLPAGSRIMLTGGYKGRSREVAPEALRAQLEALTGVPDAFMVNEYGMTELSSQLYDTCLRDAVLQLPAGPRRLWAPGWVRVTLVDGDGLQASAAHEGLVRLDDAANLDSVSAIQTADVGRRVADGFVVLGRASGAVARGCSLSVDQALSRSEP